MSWSFLDFTGLSRFFGRLPEKLVTTDTTQTISGTKSFSSTILGSVSGSAASAAKDGAGNVIADTYETKADAATHLSKSDAAGTYLSKTDAASAYVQTGAVDQTIAGTKTFSEPIVGSVTGSSGSCTGNAATATKAVSADSATNASHATSADKATKAEQDGNGNNIVASYVAAGSEGSTTDIGAFMAERPSFIKSFRYNNVWTDAISMRHRNGSDDGSNYGTYIRSSNMTGVSNLLWNHQNAGKWQGERTLVDSANLADFIKSAVTSLDASKLTGTASVSTTGNAATATKLQTARTINGTGFDGTANITTANWGTARNISITDGTNTSTAVSVNGSANVSLNLPATIKANLTGNCSGSSGSCTGNAATATTATTAKSCTGNAATATKLATARTIALSGAATGTATGFDGSGNITIPVTALAASAIRAQWYAAYPDGAEAHNAMWGGRDITAAFDAGTVSTNIANGTFKDIFPGDYITKQVTIPQVLADDGTTVLFAGGTYTVNWVVADCDYWINKGDDAMVMTAHHVVIVPLTQIFFARMNATNTTEGGYAGSEMYKNVIPACATGIVSAFGSEHILTFRDCATNNMNASATSPGLSGWFTGVAQGVAWASMQCNLMSEGMVYGNSIWSSSGDDNCIGLRQMSAFRLSERLINYNRQWWWLRNVVSSAYFAFVNGYGLAAALDASGVFGVRPFALLV